MSDSAAHHPKLTMDENKRLHLEARRGLIRELLQWTEESGNGGEYYISVNGNRMWLSYKEAQNTIIAMLATINVRLDMLLRNEYPEYDNIE